MLDQIIAVAAVVGGLLAAGGVGWLFGRRRSLRSADGIDRDARERLRKLQQAVEQSPSTVVITSLDGTIEYVNPKFTALTGYTSQEAIGQKTSIVKSGLTPPEVYSELWRAIQAGREWRGEFLNRKKSGELNWEYASICGVKDEQGRITHFVAVKEDITARKQVEAALEEARARSQAVLAAMPDLVFHLTRDGMYLSEMGNAAPELRTADLPPEAVVGQTLYDLLPEPQARLIHDAIHRALDTRTLQVIEYQLPTLSGVRDFEARIVPTGADSVISVARDVTQRRALELALQSSEAKYRSVAEQANDGIGIVQNGIVRYANPQLAALIGWSVEDLLGKSFEEYVAPQARDALRERYQRRLHNDITPSRYETCLWHRDGYPLQVEINSGVIDYEGQPAQLAFVRDMSERKRAEDERERLILELKAFAHTVAHDLKSPLHGLIGYASLLAEDPGLVPEDQLVQYLRTIESYAFKMNGIVDDLLLLASVRSLDEVPIDAIDMRAAINEAVTRLQHKVHETHAQITLSDEPLPLAQGYAPWVTQVWVNYLSNALKYGGSPPEIAIGGEAQPDGFVRFWVRDRGPGIPVEFQPRLFGRFERVGDLKVEGYGLGLSIVKRIVERLGGQVGVISAEGAGAEFFFTLPAAEQSSSSPRELVLETE